ncbi:MAG: hypothetical protein ACC628_10460 [Pirellulaceae bacterium]
MALPEFTQTGDLPVGVHAASLAETAARFGTGSDQRKRLARRLTLVHQLASGTGHIWPGSLFSGPSSRKNANPTTWTSS